MAETHLPQPGFTYTACGPFTKNQKLAKKEIKKQVIQVTFINLFKNGGVECDKICKHYGMNRIKTIFF